MKRISEVISIPVNVLIRPRSGNFCYTIDEFEQMKSDIEICKKIGFNGIVSGILKNDNSIDIERTQELIALSKPMSFTFHRAFDCVSNPQESLKQLIDLKVNRILTSGLQEKAFDGITLLKELQKTAKNNLIILPGSGINVDNISHFKEAGFKEVHASASEIINSEKSVFFGNTSQTISSTKKITQLIKKKNNA